MVVHCHCSKDVLKSSLECFLGGTAKDWLWMVGVDRSPFFFANDCMCQRIPHLPLFNYEALHNNMAQSHVPDLFKAQLGRTMRLNY